MADGGADGGYNKGLGAAWKRTVQVVGRIKVKVQIPEWALAGLRGVQCCRASRASRACRACRACRASALVDTQSLHIHDSEIHLHGTPASQPLQMHWDAGSRGETGCPAAPLMDG